MRCVAAEIPSNFSDCSRTTEISPKLVTPAALPVKVLPPSVILSPIAMVKLGIFSSAESTRGKVSVRNLDCSRPFKYNLPFARWALLAGF